MLDVFEGPDETPITDQLLEHTRKMQSKKNKIIFYLSFLPAYC